ncbi:uncharacterized protein BJ212DRAFT_179637 [Suillus subaureus]|uniref:Uncharacterized protein n=1 Tax=Suillus subaureus TaxID=48587 RepID=A0A9P7EBK4_9AGAM|nr:uncharacterized protein BJ212DRAFT_179637 [Suillus subaureus]KAG1816865.1 hypothetical protein BJ212DRAFT_179637 [Suillus subaureus]
MRQFDGPLIILNWTSILNTQSMPGPDAQNACANRSFGYVHFYFTVLSIKSEHGHIQIIIHLFPFLSPDSPKFNFLPTLLIPLIQLLPCLLLCLSSFLMWCTEVILKVGYRAHAAYQERVAMLVPLITPEALLSRRGRQGTIEALVGTGSSSEGEGTQDVLIRWTGRIFLYSSSNFETEQC